MYIIYYFFSFCLIVSNILSVFTNSPLYLVIKTRRFQCVNNNKYGCTWFARYNVCGINEWRSMGTILMPITTVSCKGFVFLSFWAVPIIWYITIEMVSSMLSFFHLCCPFFLSNLLSIAYKRVYLGINTINICVP